MALEDVTTNRVVGKPIRPPLPLIQAARLTTARWALTQPDPHATLADLLAALDIDTDDGHNRPPRRRGIS